MTFPLLVVLQLARGVAGPMPPPTTPPGLEVELRTVAHKTTFRLSELIPLEVAFRVTGSHAFAIELADGWNGAPTTDRFLIEPRESVIDRNAWWLEGTICCDSRRSLLTSVPAVYPHELTDFIRFTKPGEYRIQYATRRVFPGRPVRAYDSSAMLVSSNVLTVRIVEDDPRWIDDVLQIALEGADPTPVMGELRERPKLPMRGSLLKPVASDAMMRYRRATRQLRMLDTPEAIRARVFRLRMPSVEEWRASEVNRTGFVGVDTSVATSSRPDLVADALRSRAARPDFGITLGYFDLWTRVVLERDHPELVRLTRADGEPLPESAADLLRVARRDLVAVLRELAVSKSGVAAEITAATIRSVESDPGK